jgi:hypothetical protein
LAKDEIPEYMKNVHYVFSMDEMIRYILFREKLAKIKGKTNDDGGSLASNRD